MIIKGTVESIVFRNDDNGYTVIYFDADNRFITAVGIFPTIQEGEPLTLVGEFINNPKYGEQFDVKEVSYNAPSDKAGIINYLASGLFYGVGDVTAQAIVKKFGHDTLNIIENTPMRLTEVKGVGAKRAAEIGETYKAYKGMQNTMLFLQKHGITTSQALKIYKEYEDKTIEIISENPYKLIEDIDGIGFLTADKIAEKVGIEKDSDFRVMAVITHVLQESASKKGNTYLPYDSLLELCTNLVTNIAVTQIDKCISVMLFNRKLSTFNIQDENGEVVTRAYALSLNYNTENAIAAKLVRLVSDAKPLDIDVDKEIAQYEKFNKISLHTAQKDGIKTAINSGAMVLTGGPGTGKTTIIKCILELLKARNLKVMLAAPTGRAAKRISETTDEEAKTIHRMLGLEFTSGKLNYKFNEFNTFDADVLIVDEISMADIYIFNAMVKAMPTGARLVLVGDKDQLQSVSAGNILSDIIASNVMPVVELTEIYRQDADSLIILNAHRVNNGQMPVLNNKSHDFFVDNKEDTTDILHSVISMISHRLPSYFDIKPSDIQVLSPIKRGIAGVENLNKTIQQALNPYGKEILINGTTFRVGDKVMHAVNNYNLKWEKNVGYIEEGEGVFNGDIGYIVDIRQDKSLVVDFEDGKQVVYSRETQDELMLAYALSVHKSQGSEFNAVILVLSNAPYMLLSRNLLYTAITRAKNLAVIIGSHKNISLMVQNNYTEKRYTLLKELIWENLRKVKLLRS